MSTGVKVLLIGCISVLVIGALVLGVGGYMVKNWFTEKTKTLGNAIGTEDSEYGQKIEELNKKYPFAAPSNNLIGENQLQRFLAVRKEMDAVYKQYEGEIKEISNKQNANPSDALKGLTMVSDIRMAQLKGLQAHNMSKDEYQYLTAMVYVNWVSMTLDKALHDQQAANSSVEQLKQSLAQMDQQLQNPDLLAEQKQQLQTTRDATQQQIDTTTAQIQQMETHLQSIPKENLELFRKYDSEIKQYGMTGLEFLGI